MGIRFFCSFTFIYLFPLPLSFKKISSTNFTLYIVIIVICCLGFSVETPLYSGTTYGGGGVINHGFYFIWDITFIIIFTKILLSIIKIIGGQRVERVVLILVRPRNRSSPSIRSFIFGCVVGYTLAGASMTPPSPSEDSINWNHIRNARSHMKKVYQNKHMFIFSSVF